MASIRVLLEAFGDAGRPLSKSPDVPSATNLVRLCYFVVLISYALCAGDEECLAKNIKCYECSTQKGDKFCADPFNASHPNAIMKNCEGVCAKWVRIPKKGQVHYVRTCSATLNMQMHVSLVCMQESRPGDGHLCFCKTKKCNGATRTGTNYSGVVVAMLVAFLVILVTNDRPLDGIQEYVHSLNQYASKHRAQSLRKKHLDTKLPCPPDCAKQALHVSLVVNKQTKSQETTKSCCVASLAPSTGDDGHQGVIKHGHYHPILQPSILGDGLSRLGTLFRWWPKSRHQSKSSLQIRTPEYNSM